MTGQEHGYYARYEERYGREWLTWRGRVWNALATMGLCTNDYPAQGVTAACELWYDPRIHERGGLYVETWIQAEGSDRVWRGGAITTGRLLVAAGDLEHVFVLGAKTLQRQWKQAKALGYQPFASETSRGFLLPLGSVRSLALATFTLATGSETLDALRNEIKNPSRVATVAHRPGDPVAASDIPGFD